MKRYEIINRVIESKGYIDYLEIGVRDGECFKQICCKNKTGVDPNPTSSDTTHRMTSDDFFMSISEDTKFDIIFIDGLHHDDQVLKDIENSLNHLSDNGTIVCHDCLPTTEKMQERDDHGGEWTGDVWKAIAELRVDSIDLDIKVVDTDYGCGIIRRGTNIPYETTDNYKSYYHYSVNKWRMLNVISPQQFIQWINIA